MGVDISIYALLTGRSKCMYCAHDLYWSLCSVVVPLLSCVVYIVIFRGTVMDDRMTGKDYAVMCSSINTHTYTLVARVECIG